MLPVSFYVTPFYELRLYGGLNGGGDFVTSKANIVNKELAYGEQ